MQAVRTVLEGAARKATIDTEGRFVIIGERINPSGRRRLAESLTRGEMSLVRREALAQVEAGADIIDVNVSAADVNEEIILPLAVQTVAETVDVPVCIDAADHVALDAALAVCPGKPLVNSVTGEYASLQTVLPLVKEHSCSVIGLCMDEEGIPGEASRRLEIAYRILRIAEDYGIAREDVVLDPLAMAVGVDHGAGVTTLTAVRLISSELRCNMTIGASNVSFGLPARGMINRTFIAMLTAAGLTSAILDPLDIEMRSTVSACDLLLGRDEYAGRFIREFRRGWQLED